MELKVDNDTSQITVEIPLTGHTGKCRVKRRKNFHQFGEPIATKRVPLGQDCYIEWQIGYDLPLDRSVNSTLPHIVFMNNKGVQKCFYELSEYLYYFFNWGLITSLELGVELNYLSNLKEKDLLSNLEELQIQRDRPEKVNVNEVYFYKSILKYPQITYVFEDGNLVAEIIIREKQRAVGIQPMLYFCFPITNFESGDTLIGRTAKTKETAQFVFNKKNFTMILRLTRIFGILSPAHHADVIGILRTVLKH